MADVCLKNYRDTIEIIVSSLYIRDVAWKSKRCSEKIQRKRGKGKRKRYYVGGFRRKKEKDRSDCRIKIHYDKTLIAERIIRDTMCNLGFQTGKRASSHLNNVTFAKRGNS